MIVKISCRYSRREAGKITTPPPMPQLIFFYIRSKYLFNAVGLNGKFLRFRRDGPFLNGSVTCDEKWIFYDNVIRKRQWFRPG
jgi:hypothetical protein